MLKDSSGNYMSMRIDDDLDRWTLSKKMNSEWMARMDAKQEDELRMDGARAIVDTAIEYCLKGGIQNGDGPAGLLLIKLQRAIDKSSDGKTFVIR